MCSEAIERKMHGTDFHTCREFAYNKPSEKLGNNMLIIKIIYSYTDVCKRIS